MNDLRPTDERIRTWVQAEAPAHAPAGLLEASLARSAGVAPLPRRPSIAGVPRVWLAVAATLGLVITTVIGMALASEVSRRDVDPRPTPSVEAVRGPTSARWSDGLAFRSERDPSTAVVEAVIRR